VKAIDWRDSASHKLVRFVCERYGAVAAELAFGLTRGTVRGFVHRERVVIVPSSHADQFSAHALVEFCIREGITHGGLPATEGGHFGNPVLEEVAAVDCSKVQTRYLARLTEKTLYATSPRPRAAPNPPAPKKVAVKPKALPVPEPAPEPVAEKEPEPKPAVVEASGPVDVKAPEPVAKAPEKAAVAAPSVPKHSPAPQPLAPARSVSAASARVDAHRPVRDRVPSAAEVRALECDSTEDVEYSVEVPGEDAARLARLRKKFPNAVNFFKAKAITRAGVRTNVCRTPLWDLDPECLSTESPYRVKYNNYLRDRSRYVCGNPTESTDSFTCRACARALGDPVRGKSYVRFTGKGDGSASRFVKRS
jgi:outer membrane biosynthesis protein TonB